MTIRCLHCMEPVQPNAKICPNCSQKIRPYSRSAFVLPQGTLLGGSYEVVWVLGFGGFGNTYLCYDINNKQKIAIKEYCPDVVTRDNQVGPGIKLKYDDEASVEEFERGKRAINKEATILSDPKIHDDPGIAGVYNKFEENGTVYLVMDYIEGETLAQRLKEQKTIPLGELMDMLGSIFDSLDSLHKKNLIHRDISPNNIILRPDGSACLVDFGCARSYMNNGKTLTKYQKRGYTPWEQCEGNTQGPFTDVYALSATILECVTGKRPPNVYARKEGHESLVMPSDVGVVIESYQEQALLAGMSIKPEERIHSVSELLAELRGAGEEETEYAADGSTEQRLATERSRLSYDPARGAVGIGGSHIVAVKSDGHVLATGTNECGQCEVEQWTNVVQVSCGYKFTVGLRKNGTCITAGDYFKGHDDVSTWTDVTEISCGAFHVLGMSSKGDAVAFGRSGLGQCDVEDWHDLVAIAAGNNHSVGLTRNGRVVYVGDNRWGQCDTNGWEDVTQIAASGDHTLGLTSKGKILATGDVSAFRFGGWEGVLSIATGLFHAVGLANGGWVLHTGHSSDGVDKVVRWSGVLAIYAGYGFAVAVRTDGLVLSTRSEYEHSSRRTSTKTWRLFTSADADIPTSKFEEVRVQFVSLANAQLPLVKKCMVCVNQHNPNHPLAFPNVVEEDDPLAIVMREAQMEFDISVAELIAIGRQVWELYNSIPMMPPLNTLMLYHCGYFTDFLNTLEQVEREQTGSAPSKGYELTKKTYDAFVEYAANLEHTIRELNAIP